MLTMISNSDKVLEIRRHMGKTVRYNEDEYDGYEDYKKYQNFLKTKNEKKRKSKEEEKKNE
jgi:hypothetical protein